MFKLRHSNAQSLYNIANDLKSPEGRVSLDANSNTLIVLDYPNKLQQIASVIDSLDVSEKNVEIKVVVTDISSQTLNNLGLSSGQVIIPSGQYSLLINNIKSDNKSKIRSEMTLKTLSNHPARLAVSKDEIFGHSVTLYSSRHNDVVVVDPLRKQLGSFLEVLPTANNDGTINVVIQPTVSNMKGSSPYERTILTQVILNSGDTVAIGGVDSGTTQTTTTQTSLFGIPLSKTSSNQQSKVMMFLTATIVE